MAWIGAAGDAFRDAIGQFPGQLDKVATSHHTAADALDGYATDLDHAQGQADRALWQAREVHDRVRSLQGQLAAATGTLNSLDGAADTTPRPPDRARVREQARRHAAAQTQVDSLSAQLAAAGAVGGSEEARRPSGRTT